MSVSMKKRAAVVLFLAIFAQAGDAAPAKPVAPPWAGKPVPASQVPDIYLARWSKAENRNKCAAMVLTAAKKQPKAKARKADFSGGWAVAYDLPGERSSFGIAGTGSLALDQNDATIFPNLVRWSDGSYASYGLEGGSGPGYLAYVTVAGQACLYNVWSKQGKRHLEELVFSMRFAEKPGK